MDPSRDSMILELKAAAYDTLVQLEQLQGRLRQLNARILEASQAASLSPELESSETPNSTVSPMHERRI